MKALITIFVLCMSLSAQVKQLGPVKMAGPAIQTFGSAGVTWSLIQGTAAAAKNFTCGASACATGTLTPTTAGDLEIVLWAGFADRSGGVSPLTSNAVSGDSSMVHCSGFPQQYQYTSGNFELIDCFYKLSATGGATSFTITPTWEGSATSQTQDIQFIEVHRSTGSATIDSQNSSQSNTCTSSLCITPTLTIAGTSDYCANWGAFAANPPTAISGSYSSPSNFDSSNVFGGFSGKTNISSYAQVNWSMTTASPDGAQLGVICFQ